MAEDRDGGSERMASSPEAASRRWGQVFEAIQTPLLVLDPGGRVQRATRPARALLAACNLPEVPGGRLADLPLDEPWTTLRRLVAGVGPGSAALRDSVRGGDGRTWEISVAAFHPPLEEAGWALAELHDVSEVLALRADAALQRGHVRDAERDRASLLTAQRDILERIASGAPLPEVLRSIVALAEDRAPGLLASILLLEDGVRLRQGAAPSLPATWCAAIDGLTVGPRQGSCGTAAYLREAVVVSDVACSPLWVNYREVALRHGLRACWSTPILSSAGEVLGTLALYYREPRSPSRSHWHLIGVAAELARVALERVRADERQVALLAAAPAALALLDGERRIVRVNALWIALARECGLSVAWAGAAYEEALGPLLDEETRADLRARLDSALSGVLPPPRELVVDGPAGRRWLQWRAAPLGRGQRGAVVVHTDVTERARSEQALRESEDRFRTLIQDLPVGVALLGPRGEFRSCNRAAGELLGRTEADLVGTSCLDAAWDVVDDDGTPVAGHAQPAPRAIAARRAVRNVVLGIARPGREERAWVVASAEPRLDRSGELREVMYTLADVGAQRSAEAARRESEERFRTVADAVPAILYMRDAEAGVTFVNRRWEEFTGRAGSEALGSGWAVGLHPEDLAAVMRAFAQGVAERRAVAIDYRLRRADGEFRWVSDTAEPRFGTGRAFLGFVGSAVDVTGRRLVATRLEELSDRLQTLVEALPDAVILKDGGGRWETANRAAIGILGLEDVDWRGRTDEQLGHLLPRSREAFEALALSDELAWRLGRRHDSVDLLRDRAGLPLYFEASRVPLSRSGGGRRGIVLLGRNATERRIAEDALQLAALVFEQNSEGIMITDAERRILRVNRAFTQITGYQPEEVLGRTPGLLASGRHGPEFYAAMWQTLELTGSWRGEIWNRRKNGEVYPEWLSISAVKDARGQVLRYVGSFSDVAEKKQLEEERRRLALHDPLTGLPNRTLIEESLRLAFLSERGRVALFLLDLSRFERINSTLGFAVGDRLLEAVASRLSEVLGGCAMLGRWYGDEFAVVAQVPEAEDQPGISGLVDALRRALDDPMAVDGRSVQLSAVLGAAISPGDGRDAASLVRSAETALGHARAQGPGSYRFHTADMDRVVHDRLQLEEDLTRAMERGELGLHFQPLLDVVRGRVVGAEALLRWQHPERGTVPPGLFVAVAEENGSIVPIGRMVLRQACRALASWRAQGLGVERIAVNLSSRQLVDAAFVDTVAESLAAHDLPARSLELEITESVFVDRAGPALPVLARLAEMGVHLTIDDFGTGFSSLAYLKQLPVSTLKIDRSFVAGLPDDESDVAIVRAIVALAKSRRLSVTAEGVETQAQARFLALHGCDLLQGHLYGAAVAGPDFEAAVRRLS